MSSTSLKYVMFCMNIFLAIIDLVGFNCIKPFLFSFLGIKTKDRKELGDALIVFESALAT